MMAKSPNPEGNRWTLKAGGVGIDDWGFWQAFRASLEGTAEGEGARHELGTGFDGGAELTTLFMHDEYLERKGLCAARRPWLDTGSTLSCRTGEIAALPQMRGRTRTCIIEIGNAKPTHMFFF